MLRFTLILAMVFIVMNVSLAQATYEVTSSTFTVAGTSSLHEWESDVTQVNATGQMIVEGTMLKTIDNFTVTIPVKGIKSSKGSIMDKKTWGALDNDKHPNITFKLTKVNTIDQSGDSHTIKVTGNLTIAGKTKAINMNVKGKVIGTSGLQFEGSKDLKMSDFGIDPPTALMGTLKTGDDITVKFTVKMAKSKVTGNR